MNQVFFSCPINRGSTINIQNMGKGIVGIIAEEKNENLAQGQVFKLKDICSLLPYIEKTIDEMENGTFNYGSESSTVKSIPNDKVEGVATLKFVGIEDDDICLQFFSDQTMCEICINLTCEDAKHLVESCKNFNLATA